MSSKSGTNLYNDLRKNPNWVHGEYRHPANDLMQQVMLVKTTPTATQISEMCKRLALHLRRDRTAEGKKSRPLVVRRDHLLHPSDHHIVRRQRRAGQRRPRSQGGEKKRARYRSAWLAFHIAARTMIPPDSHPTHIRAIILCKQ